MEGVLHVTFNNPDDASPSSSPMRVDARDLPAGVDPADTGLFSPGSVGSTLHAQSRSRNIPANGLGLSLQEPPVQVLCVDPQVLLLVRDADTRPATPTTPTRRSLQEQGVQALRRAALGLTTSFVALACSLGNSQPANVGFQAPPHADSGAAADASAGVDAGLAEQDPGVETEVEEDVAPSPAATLPLDPLPLSEDLTACLQGKRGTKRAAVGSAKRASKRQRSTKSSAQHPLVEPEPDADDQPATSSTGRPTRKAAQRGRLPDRQESPPSGNEAVEGSSSCTKCGKSFGRTYDLDRHLRLSACANADKLVCRVCGNALSPRSDAQRRHLMTTDKCVALQSKMPPELLAVLGCPTPEERAEYLELQAERKTASKKSKKCK